MPIATSSQTIGPYWHMMEHPEWANLTRFGAEGEKISLIGTVTDGDGLPVSDAAIEIWQASPEASDDFPGYGRCATDVEGNFRFTTLKPGAIPGPGNASQAPHVAILLLARGLLKALATRAYFDGDPHNETDPVLTMIEDPARRGTLLARDVGPREGLPTWRLDIRLQGEDETVFMEV